MNTTMSHVGIPTRYKGRQYRSRLEARWACFFDLLGWRYEYEPCDFEGWIPDFAICEAKTVFVEVKPVATFPEEVAAKIEATSCTKDVLIVGVTLIPGPGWLGEYHGKEGMAWGCASFGMWTPAPRCKPRIGFCHEEHSFQDRITGQYDGGCHGELTLDVDAISDLWAEAGNVTQWQKEVPSMPRPLPFRDRVIERLRTEIEVQNRKAVPHA